MNELQFQTALCKRITECNGFAMKMSNAYLAGVPDLFVSLPGVGNCFLECKLAKVPAVVKEVRINITKLQIEYLQRIERSGTVAGVAVLLVDEKKRAKMAGFFVPDYFRDGENRVHIDRFKDITTPKAMDSVVAWVSSFITWQKHLNGSVAMGLTNVASREDRNAERKTRTDRPKGRASRVHAAQRRAARYIQQHGT